MSAWFEFFLKAVKDIVETVFKLDLGFGFSLGDIEVALLVIGIVASALVLKVTNTAGGAINENITKSGNKHNFSKRTGVDSM